NPLRIDAGTRDIDDCLGVRFGFRCAAVLRKPRRAADIDRHLGCATVADVREIAEQRDADVGATGTLHLLRGMPPNDVPYLVTKRTRELIHPFGGLGETAFAVHE